MTNLRSLKDVKEGKHTTLPDEIETYPKTTCRDILICVGIGVVIATVIAWRIYA